MFRIVSSSDVRSVARLVERRALRDTALERRVAGIVADVRQRGDRAVGEYAARFDDLQAPIEVTRAEMVDGWRRTPAPARAALGTAARHIRRLARRQLPRPHVVEIVPGVRIEQRVTPLDRVGCYVPGGRYPLPSSLLMTAVPAREAGVKEIAAVCPRPAPIVMAAALEAGVTRLFRIGGAHAIAALAYGTRTVPRVDKIVGPGSAFVAAAKTLVAPDCAIDFFAGPSEIVVVSATGNPDWIAADLVAQAEHDPDARAILITPSRRLASSVARCIAARMPTVGPAHLALARRGGAIVTRSIAEAALLAARIAPEHLVCDDEAIAARVATAGTTFVGPFSAQAAGDYATGSNHVLPTAGAARFRGGLSVADFVRVSTVQRLSRRGLRRLAPTVITLAEAEGLTAHAASIEARLS
jgi:histidinol dehydrogenase